MTKDEVLEAIKQMSILDLSELVKSLESDLGITAAVPMAPVAAAAAAGGATAPTAEATAAAAGEDEQTEFAVLLEGIGSNKINVIKAVRELTSLGLREAKELVESAPSRVKESVSNDDAKKAKEVLEAAGASVKIE